MAALGEANDSVEKREKSHGDERAGRWIGVSARGNPRHLRATTWHGVV